MGVLTEHLTQLRNEILALRSARQGLAQVLERETEERRADVSQTLANFSKSFAARARRTKADRLDSLSDLKRTVDGLRTQVHTDLSSIRQAWRALGTPSRGAVENSQAIRCRKPKPPWKEARAKQVASNRSQSAAVRSRRERNGNIKLTALSRARLPLDRKAQGKGKDSNEWRGCKVRFSSQRNSRTPRTQHCPGA